MQLNSVTDVSKSRHQEKFILKILFYFFKVSGLGTISLKFQQSNNYHFTDWVFSYSKLGFVYNIILLLLLSGINIFGIKSMFKTNYSGRFKQDNLIVAIFDVVVATSSLLLPVVFFVKQNKIVSIANKINIVRKLLVAAKKGNNIIENKALYKITFLFFVQLVILLVLLIWSLRREFHVMIYGCAFSLDVFIVNSLFSQYILILKFLDNSFKIINDNLKIIQKQCIVHHEMQLVSESNFQTEIDQLKFTYLQISKLAEEISDFYSLPILSSILNIFINTLVCSYILIKQIIFLNNTFATFNLPNLSFIYLNITSFTSLTIHVTNTVKAVRYFHT